MFLRPLSQVDFASSLYTSPASSQRSYGAREVPVPSKKKKYINPLVMQKEESLLILKWLSRQTDKTIFYESDFPAFSLRASEYELNTEPPLLLMKQDTSEQDKRYFYLIGDEFHDGKFGVKIYRVKGVFTLCRQHIYFRDTPGLLVKKQIHSDELSCERTRREYEFNIAAGYSQAGFYFVDRKKTAFTTLFFMDAVNGLNLDELMKERQMYTSAQLLSLCFNAISALRSIHQLGVVHRDVKPANLVADTSNRDNPVVKLIDFDMSKPAEEKDAGSAPGTIGYAAPEIFNGESTDYKSDVFSLGMVFSEILGIHYLMSHAKKQTPGTDSPFILLDTKRYSPELASRLIQFLVMMTRMEKTERCSLDEAEIELGRIILYHQGELLKNIDQKHFSFSKAAACDKLQKLSVSGCAREITAAVKLLRQANELVQKIRFKTYNEISLTKILHEFSFAVIDLVPARDEQDSGADQLRHLFEIHLDKLLVQACSEDKVPVIQFLLEQGASLRRIHALENSSAMFPGMILHDETRQYLRLYSLIDAIAQDDNEYRSEALNYLKQAAVRLPTNEIGQALSSFNLIEECSIRMKKKFGELSFPVNNELILNALGKVYRFLTGNQDGNAVRQYLTRASDDLVLAAAVSAVERNAANQLDEIMKAFPDVTRIALRDGTTLLHIAAQYPNSGIVKLLLEAGCDPDQARSDDLTPRKIAAQNGFAHFPQTSLKPF